MAHKVKMVVLKDGFLGKVGREFLSASPSQIAALEKSGIAKRVETKEASKADPKKKGKPGK